MTAGKAALWQSIATTLIAEIAQGQYRPGNKLPTEAQMADRFGVNRHTVRRALSGLVDQGLVYTRRGSGVFVTSQPTSYPLGRRVRFSENVLAFGQTPSRTITRSETRPAGQREAATLNLDTAALVHVIEGISFADAMPLAMFRSVFPAAQLVNLLTAVQQTGSISDALARVGVVDYTRVSTAITAKLATPTQAIQLRIPTAAPILRSVAINQDTNGVLIEYGTTWFAGDRVTLTVNPD